MAFPDPTPGKRNDLLLEATGKNGFDKSTLSRARYVLRNNPIPDGEQYPQRCLDIMSGSLSLTEAYDLTQADVKQQEGNDPLDIGLNALDTLDKGKHNSNLNVSGFAKRLGKSQGYLTKVFQAATVFSKIIP